MAAGMIDPENTLEDVKVRIQKSYRNPNVASISQAVLKAASKMIEYPAAVPTSLEHNKKEKDLFKLGLLLSYSNFLGRPVFLNDKFV